MKRTLVRAFTESSCHRDTLAISSILGRSEESATKDQPDDPIFTTKGVILVALYCCIYAAIIFSMDPEWVGWAGPMAFGALYVPNQPPPLFSDPAVAFEMGAKLSLLNLLVLVIVSVIREEEPFGLRSLFKAWLKKSA